MNVRIYHKATKIWERHELLEATVGFFEEELLAYKTATTLVRIVFFLFPVLSFLEIFFYIIYQKRVCSPHFLCQIMIFMFSSIPGERFSRRAPVVPVAVPVPVDVCPNPTAAPAPVNKLKRTMMHKM